MDPREIYEDSLTLGCEGCYLCDEARRRDLRPFCLAPGPIVKDPVTGKCLINNREDRNGRRKYGPVSHK